MVAARLKLPVVVPAPVIVPPKVCVLPLTRPEVAPVKLVEPPVSITLLLSAAPLPPATSTDVVVAFRPVLPNALAVALTAAPVCRVPRSVTAPLVMVRWLTASPVTATVTLASVLPNSSVGVELKLPLIEPAEPATPPML